jgi:alpha-2-macroglobulin-like protein
VALKMEKGSEMPFALSFNYFDTKPASADQCKVGLTAKLRDTKLAEGAITEVAVSVTNKSDQPIPTPIAIIGIPGGLEVRHDQLKELVKSGKIDAYEVINRDVILYWRGIKASDKIDLPISLTAGVPGTYTGPASRAYLYYTDEFKQWVDGMKVEITTR